MTEADVAKHQAKHGFAPLIPARRSLVNAFLTSGKVDIANTPKKGKKRRQMNLLEQEFSQLLQNQFLNGEILGYEYEAITLRFGEIKYTPDFMVRAGETGNLQFPHVKLIFHECKGPFIREKDLLRFKAAKFAFPYFEFQMWQRTKNREWIRLH